jgi:hypothetical protein
MVTRLASIVLALLSFVAPVSGSGRGSHRSSPYSSARSHSNVVHVRSYTRKDGTVVGEYTRSYPGKGSSRHSSSVPGVHHNSPISVPNGRDSHGRIKRSVAAKDTFRREHHCPSTGRASGPCPGYVIDHVKPLACGGLDDPSNMQWQTVADGKAKDKWERKGCGRFSINTRI